MFLLQEALQAVALLPTLSSPSLCPSPDGAGRRTLPDWETPESKGHLHVHVSLGTGREGTEDGFSGEGQEVASLARAQKKGGDWTGAGCVGREVSGRETPEPRGAGRAGGLGSLSARCRLCFCF